MIKINDSETKLTALPKDQAGGNCAILHVPAEITWPLTEKPVKVDLRVEVPIPKNPKLEYGLKVNAITRLHPVLVTAINVLTEELQAIATEGDGVEHFMQSLKVIVPGLPDDMVETVINNMADMGEEERIDYLGELKCRYPSKS
jgi:hypothetical protein